MRALANLAKFHGMYNNWLAIVSNYQLNWQRDTEFAFQQIYDNKQNINVMLDWIRSTRAVLSQPYANILLFATLTGLRPTGELFDCIDLIHSEGDSYYNRERGTLEHFRYPKLFIRKSKRAYITVTSEKIIELANEAPPINYNTLRKFFGRELNRPLHLNYCRKVFATYLRQHDIEAEMVDLLQGRLPTSVFARHYYRPDFGQSCDKIRASVMSLHKEITQ